MKKWMIGLFCVMLLAGLTACGPKDTQSGEGQTQLPNPMVEYDSLEEAEAAAGTDYLTPSQPPEGYELEEIHLISGDTLQLLYRSGDSELRFRAQATKEAKDISGDYNDYPVGSSLVVGEESVDMRGDGNTVSVATWWAGGFSYSLGADPGLEEEAVQAVLESLA